MGPATLVDAACGVLFVRLAPPLASALANFSTSTFQGADTRILGKLMVVQYLAAMPTIIGTVVIGSLVA